MKRREKYFRRQKLMGLGMIILSVIFTGVLTLLGESAGILLIGVPLGIYLIFTKEMVLDDNYKFEMEAKEAHS